jgi:hypothetical protein
MWKTGDLTHKKGVVRVIGTDLILNNDDKLEIKLTSIFDN